MSRQFWTFLLPWHAKLLVISMARGGKKDARSITLQEHLESIAAKGGRARAELLSPERQSEIGKKAGKVGGKARARALTKEQRQEIARKAAAARWGKQS